MSTNSYHLHVSYTQIFIILSSQVQCLHWSIILHQNYHELPVRLEFSVLEFVKRGTRVAVM